jgi:hypothetical protein
VLNGANVAEFSGTCTAAARRSAGGGEKGGGGEGGGESQPTSSGGDGPAAKGLELKEEGGMAAEVAAAPAAPAPAPVGGVGGKNTYALGTKVEVLYDDGMWYGGVFTSKFTEPNAQGKQVLMYEVTLEDGTTLTTTMQNDPDVRLLAHGSTSKKGGGAAKPKSGGAGVAAANAAAMERAHHISQHAVYDEETGEER